MINQNMLQMMQKWITDNQRMLNGVRQMLTGPQPDWEPNRRPRQGSAPKADRVQYPAPAPKAGRVQPPAPAPKAGRVQPPAPAPKAGAAPATERAAKGGSHYTQALDISRYTAASLKEEDLRTIIGLYGNSVEDIYELGAGQKWMLETGQRVKSAFFLQILTKAVISLDPAVFRQHADEVCAKHESLRSAFVWQNVGKPYRVVLKDRHPEIIYYDFSDLDMASFDAKMQKQMEADRLRGFDLERDALLRISVYKSCEKDTYALIVSQPHINSDGTSLGLLFGDLFIGYALDLNGIDKKIEARSYQAYAEHLQQVDTEKELAHWKEVLADEEEDQRLPGQEESDLDYENATYFVPFPEQTPDLLKKAQKALKVTQFTILQGIWGVMVSRLKERNSIVFGSITSGRDADVSDSMQLSGGFVNVLPVRVQFEDAEPFADLLKRLQTQFAEAMTNSHCSPDQIREALGRKEPVFGHILNNHNFARPKSDSSGFGGGGIPGIQIVGGDTYDNLSEDLCVYFTVMHGKPGCNYSYNARVFSPEIIELLGEYFVDALSILENLTPKTRICDFPEFDAALMNALQEARRTEQMKIAGLMKRHPVFSDASDEELLALSEVCHMRVYAEDEMIVRKGCLMEGIPVLVSGNAVLYGETMEGWINPLRILKSNSLLSISGLFEETRTSNMVSSAKDGTVVFFVPTFAMKEFCLRHPNALFAITKLLYQEKNQYMKLWMNAE